MATKATQASMKKSGKETTDLETDPHRQALKFAAREPQRAVSFGGGGPAVGISVGFLLALEEFNDRNPKKAIEFPVWFAGCVGGWLTCMYHLCEFDDNRRKAGIGKAEAVRKKIEGFFRESAMFDRFPTPTTFTPDLPEMLGEGLRFLLDPKQFWTDAANVPAVLQEMQKGYADVVHYHLQPNRWSEGNFAKLMLNSVMAPNPAARMLMGLLYKTPVRGINKIWFGDDKTEVLADIQIDRLKDIKPQIYLNSYNIERHDIQVYCNHPDMAPMDAKPITMDALCASSALPYILNPIQLDGQWHSEGALIDSFNFGAAAHDGHEPGHGTPLPKDDASLHPHRHRVDFNEIWVSQIVDHKQVKVPENLLDALNNLIMLYAGTTSRRDIEMMVDELNRWKMIRVLVDPTYKPDYVECLRLPVWEGAKYHWSQENFNASVDRSKSDCLAFIQTYADGITSKGLREPKFSYVFPSRRGRFGG
jgi:hypothetical protein